MHLMGHFVEGDTNILQQELCGYCGRPHERGTPGSCDTVIERSEKNSSSWTFRNVGCDFGDKFSLAYVGIYCSKRVGRTDNYPIACSLCKATVWKYSVAAHFSIMHRGPVSETITEIMRAVVVPRVWASGGREAASEHLEALRAARLRGEVDDVVVKVMEEVVAERDEVVKAFNKFKGPVDHTVIDDTLLRNCWAI